LTNLKPSFLLAQATHTFLHISQEPEFGNKSTGSDESSDNDSNLDMTVGEVKAMGGRSACAHPLSAAREPSPCARIPQPTTPVAESLSREPRLSVGEAAVLTRLLWVTLGAQPDKPGAANPTTPEDTARTHFGAAAFGCQGLRCGDDESSNLTLRHRVSGAKQRSYHRDRHQGVCTYAALRLRPQTKSENGRHLRTAQSGPTDQVPGITYTTCPPCGRLINLPLVHMYLYLHM
jgi:hypothetical protein